MSAPLPRRLVLDLERVGSREVEDWVESGAPRTDARLTLRGGPVLALPEHVRQAIARALDEDDRRPSRGLPELRAALARLLQQETAAEVDPERELLVTNGAMHALNIAFRTLLEPGDRVLIPSPNFFFEGLIRLAGGVPVYVPCREERAWRWDLEELEAVAEQGVKLFVVCNPTNPTGFLPSREELLAVAGMAERMGFFVLADESYDRFVYDDARFTSLLELDLAIDRRVVVRSLSKSHALANWRVGFLVASPLVTEAFTKVLEWECLHCAYVPQRVAQAALEGPQDWLAGVVERYQRNRDRLLAAVAESEWLSCARPAAGPFLFLNMEGAEAAAGREGAELLLEAGVPTVPGRYFRSPGHVRLPFGADGATLERLEQLLAAFRPARAGR